MERNQEVVFERMNGTVRFFTGTVPVARVARVLARPAFGAAPIIQTVQTCLPLVRSSALVTLRYFGIQLLAVGE
jgi:hypothetical protein